MCQTTRVTLYGHSENRITNLGRLLILFATAADGRDVEQLVAVAGAQVGEDAVVGQRVLIGGRRLLPVGGGLSVRVVPPDLESHFFIFHHLRPLIKSY